MISIGDHRSRGEGPEFPVTGESFPDVPEEPVGCRGLPRSRVFECPERSVAFVGRPARPLGRPGRPRAGVSILGAPPVADDTGFGRWRGEGRCDKIDRGPVVFGGLQQSVPSLCRRSIISRLHRGLRPLLGCRRRLPAYGMSIPFADVPRTPWVGTPSRPGSIRTSRPIRPHPPRAKTV